MTITVDQFRTNFPEFSDANAYLDETVQFWFDIAALFMNAPRWGAALDIGTQLYAAHNLSLQYNATSLGAARQAPGSIVGTQTNGSIDKVSWARDASAAMMEGAGAYNLSSYGLRWYQMMKLMGAGAIQVGVPSASDQYYDGAWPGPFPAPW